MGMFQALAVKGREGSIKVGYQTAMRLGRYTLTPSGANAWDVSAQVVAVDEFWHSQRPHRLELSVGQQRWCWPDVSLVVAEGMLRGSVTGRPERK